MSKNKLLIKRRNGLIRLHTSLKVSELLQSADNCVMNKALPDIFKLFGGTHCMVKFILNHCMVDKLEPVYQIIKKHKIQNDIVKVHQKNDNKQTIKKTSNHSNPFTSIPNECIYEIIAFLDKWDVNHKFKLCSKRIAILCLNEMTKISIGVMNLNTLCNTTEYVKLYPKQIIRYNASNKGVFIQEICSKRYKICEQNQLLFSRINYYNWKLIHMKTYSSSKIVTQNFLLCDKRKV
eukprot:457149_1